MRKIYSLSVRRYSCAFYAMLRHLVAGSVKTDVLLPFPNDPPIRSYLYSAYATGAISSWGGTLRPHFASLYINLYFPYSKLSAKTANDKFDFFPVLGIRQFEVLGYLQIDEWTTEQISKQSSSEQVSKFISALHAGRFLSLIVDEFYIRGTAAYLRYQFLHEIMVVGYESRTKCFITVGYLPQGSFGRRSVPATMLVAAMRSYSDSDMGHYGRTPRCTEIENNTACAPTINSSSIALQLQSYLAGSNDVTSYVNQHFGPNTAMFTILGRRYDNDGQMGISAYALFKEYLKSSVKNGRAIDLRATRVVCEHKSQILEIVKYLSGEPNSESYVREYQIIAQLAEKLHLIAFAYNVSKPADVVDRLINLLDEIVHRERQLLNNLLVFRFGTVNGIPPRKPSCAQF